jgi:tryptophan 2,3-dioxygenase
MLKTYSTYLKIDELLALQEPASDGPEHDETLFIIIHQVYELWFKETLHEVGYLQRSLEAGETARAARTLRRVLTILKTLVSQVDVLGTMTPVDYSTFRDRLEAGSGFQSGQFRHFELALGYRGDRDFSFLRDAERERMAWVVTQPSLYDSYLRYLAGRGHAIPADVLERDLSRSNPESAEVREALIAFYGKDDEATQISELMVDLDEGVQEWRYRHVKMVERVIGTKMGTGGSSGAEYLRGTLFRPLFPDLWAIRTAL